MVAEVPEQRGMGWLKQPEDDRDYQLFRVHPEIVGIAADLPAITPDLEISPFMPPIGNQLIIGSCAPWTAVANWRFALRRAGFPDFDGSELFEYVNARLLGGFALTVDSGSFIRDCFKALLQYGNAPEEDWPYDVSKYTLQPPQKAYDDALLHQAVRYVSVPNNDDAIDAVLAAGFPVAFGIPLYQNWPMGNGVFSIPNPVGGVIGGHAMNFVQADRTRRVRKIRNQWGTAWGRGGYAEVSYDYCRQAQDLWYIETVEGNIPPPPPPPPSKKVVDGIGLWTPEHGIVHLWPPKPFEQMNETVGGIGIHYTDGSTEGIWPKG